MTFGSTFGRTFSPTFQPKSQAAVASSWWLSGGIAAANAIAVYQAKGAADYAASLVNLANPGTFNLTGSDDPVFDTSYGWSFVSDNGTTLGDALITSTAIPVTGAWSIFVRFTEAADTAGRGVCHLISTHYNSQGYRVSAENNTWSRCIQYGANSYNTTGRLLTNPHIFGFAGRQAYLDGSADGSEMAESTQTANRIAVIGATNYDGAIIFKSTVKIQAIAIYNDTLTSTQVGLLTTAMNAL